MSRTVVPDKRRNIITRPKTNQQPRQLPTNEPVKSKVFGSSKTLSGYQPRGSQANRIEYEQLINAMQTVLNPRSDCKF